MQIEAGKYYKTRDGRKAFVGAKCPFDGVSEDAMFAGWIQDERLIEPSGWTEHGVYYGSECGDDLISEWIDPPQEIVVGGVTYVRKAGT